MADITMCRDIECPRKEYCYRFTANKSEFWQSYFMQSPRNEYECVYFWDIKDDNDD